MSDKPETVESHSLIVAPDYRRESSSVTETELNHLPVKVEVILTTGVDGKPVFVPAPDPGDIGVGACVHSTMQRRTDEAGSYYFCPDCGKMFAQPGTCAGLNSSEPCLKEWHDKK